jgi:hypothetical protein
VPPVAVRLRRDFTQVLNLIRAHALLHQATRKVDDHGRVVATFDDYEVVRELVLELFSDGVQASVPDVVRETVEAFPEGPKYMSQAELAEKLHLDKGTISRRVAHAIELGYLENDETRRGRPARLRRGAPLPKDVVLLPPSEALNIA